MANFEDQMDQDSDELDENGQLRKKKPTPYEGAPAESDEDQSAPSLADKLKPAAPVATSTKPAVPAASPAPALNSIATRIRRSASAPGARSTEQLDSAISQMQDLSDKYNSESAASSKPDTTASLEDAISKAKQLYSEKSNKNDWLEVAQLIGKAAVQFGAAQYGMANQGRYGRDMSNLPIAGIDYEARRKADLENYRTDVGAARDVAETENKQYQMGTQERENRYLREQAGLADTMRALAARERDDVAALRYGTMEERQNARSDMREEMQRKAALDKDIHEQLKQIGKERDDATAGIPLIADELSGDMSSKELAAVKLKHPRELGALKPEDIAAAKQAASTPGTLWGTNLDKDKFQQEISNRVASKYEDKATNLRQSLDQLWNKKKAAGQSAPPEAPAPGGKSISYEKLQAYAVEHKITTEAAQKFLESQGYAVGK